MVPPAQQNPKPGHRKPVSCIVLVRKGHLRTVKVRPWVAGLVLGAGLALSTAFIGATGYLVYRDDLLGSTFARQVRMQYEYEDRVAALRAELDRATSKHAVETQGVEGQIATLLDRQALIERRQAALDGLIGKAQRSNIQVAQAETPLPRARPDSVPHSEGVADGSGGDVLAFAPETSNPGDIITGSLIVGTPDGSAAHPTTGLKPLLSRVETSMNAAQEEQAAALDALDAAAQRESGRLSAALAPIGLSVGEATTEEPQGGPFIPAAGLHFVERVALLNRSLDELQATRQTIESLPLRAPIAATRISSRFGYRNDPFLNRPALHAGLDFVAAAGQAVHATAPGTVVSAGWQGGYGQMVEIRHPSGVSTRYGHLSAILVAPGQKVSAGAIVGRVGSTGRSTGPHLHYETRREGEAVDPALYLAAGKAL
jgi:murein DD-endopeptidase MepM/ murein hydrolase activator NlpD